MNFLDKLLERAQIQSIKHLHSVRIDIDKTPIEVTTHGYGVIVIENVTQQGLKRLVKYLTPEQKIHVFLFLKGSSVSFKYYSLWGRQKMSIQVEEKNLDLNFTHPRMLNPTDLGFGLGLRGEPEIGSAHSYSIQRDELKAQLRVQGLREQLIKSFRMHCPTFSARKIGTFRAQVPAQRAHVSIPSMKHCIVISTFQEHLKRQNFDFKFMSLKTKKEVS